MPRPLSVAGSSRSFRAQLRFCLFRGVCPDPWANCIDISLLASSIACRSVLSLLPWEKDL